MHAQGARVLRQPGPLIGHPWPMRYAATTRAGRPAAVLGVRRFAALPYAHRPGIAAYLNDWAPTSPTRYPEAMRWATFYPEPAAPRVRRRAVDAGTEVFKVHVQVGSFDLNDPLLDEAWGQVEDAGTPGRDPRRIRPGRATSTPARADARAAARHPRLTVVVAHLGAPEYDEFLSLAEDSSASTSTRRWRSRTSSRRSAPFPRDLLPRLRARREGDARLVTSRTSRTRTRTSSRRSSGSVSGTTGCGGLLAQPGAAAGRGGIAGAPGALGGLDCESRLLHNSRGADRFRLGTLVPGEAGRGASVIS